LFEKLQDLWQRNDLPTQIVVESKLILVVFVYFLKPKDKKKPKDFRIAPMGGKILFINCLDLSPRQLIKRFGRTAGIGIKKRTIDLLQIKNLLMQ